MNNGHLSKKNRIRRFHFFLMLTAFLSFTSNNSAVGQGFSGLENPAGEFYHSRALGISANGTTVVGEHRGSEIGTVGDRGAFSWTSESGMQASSGISLAGASGNGSVYAGNQVEGDTIHSEATRITNAGVTGLGYLPNTRTNDYSFAEGVSSDGAAIVGESNSNNGLEAFRWTQQSGMIGLGDLSGGTFKSRAYAVSGDGATVVGSGRTGLGDQAFRWTSSEGMIGLGYLPGVPDSDSLSRALGISADGSTIVGMSRGGSGDDRKIQAFRWTSDEGMVGLGDLAGGNTQSFGFDASLDGSRIVGRGSGPAGYDAFVWDQLNGMQSIRELLIANGNELTDWQLHTATAISDDGNIIVGFGTNPDGNTEGWIADLSFTAVPEPTSIVLLGFGALAIATRRRRFTR